MAVIINEFEVVAEAPSREPGPPAKAQNTPAPGPTASDIQWVLRRTVARKLRVMAD